MNGSDGRDTLNENRTRIQIFGAEYREDALALADMGVDHLGFCPAEDRILAAHQASLSVEDAKSLFSELPEQVDAAFIGATGETHDWSVSRAIARAVQLPCILAGGLAPTTSRPLCRPSTPGASTATPAPTGPTGARTSKRSGPSSRRSGASTRHEGVEAFRHRPNPDILSDPQRRARDRARGRKRSPGCLLGRDAPGRA